MTERNDISAPTRPDEASRYSIEAFSNTEDRLETQLGQPALQAAFQLYMEQTYQIMACLHNLREGFDNIDNSDAVKALSTVRNQKPILRQVAEIAEKMKQILNLFRFVNSRYNTIHQLHQEESFQPDIAIADGMNSIMQTFAKQLLQYGPQTPPQAYQDWQILDPNSDSQKFFSELNQNPVQLISRNVTEQLPVIYSQLEAAFKEIIAATKNGMNISMLSAAAKADILGNRMQGVSDSITLIDAGIISQEEDEQGNSLNIKALYFEIIRDWEDLLARFLYEFFHVHGQSAIFLLQSVKIADLKQMKQSLESERNRIISDQKAQRQELTLLSRMISQIDSLISDRSQRDLARAERESQATRAKIDEEIATVSTAIAIKAKVDAGDKL